MGKGALTDNVEGKKNGFYPELWHVVNNYLVKWDLWGSQGRQTRRLPLGGYAGKLGGSLA